MCRMKHPRIILLLAALTLSTTATAEAQAPADSVSAEPDENLPVPLVPLPAHGVVRITGEELQRVPAPSLGVALQGKITGATILRYSGTPQGPTSISLRGVHSLLGPTEPVYVVDGVIVSDAVLPASFFQVPNFSGYGFISPVGMSSDNGIGRMTDIPVADIERIDVLKGAAAAAL